MLLSSTIELPELIYRIKKKEDWYLNALRMRKWEGKKVFFLFQLRALLIGWSTHFLCVFFHHSPAVILHSPRLLRVKQPFVVLGLFFWSGKKLPFASVRMFLPSKVFSYEKSKWQRFSHSRSIFFFIFTNGYILP